MISLVKWEKFLCNNILHFSVAASVSPPALYKFTQSNLLGKKNHMADVIEISMPALDKSFSLLQQVRQGVDPQQA